MIWLQPSLRREVCVGCQILDVVKQKLQMNEDKTEILHVTPKRVVKSEPFPEFMNVNGTSVKCCPHSGI